MNDFFKTKKKLDEIDIKWILANARANKYTVFGCREGYYYVEAIKQSSKWEDYTSHGGVPRRTPYPVFFIVLLLK